MAEIHIATEALQLLTSRDAHEYKLLPFDLKGETLYCYGEENRDPGASILEVEVLTGKNVRVIPLDEAQFTPLLGRLLPAG